MSSIREQILNSEDIKSETITIKEWGVEVEIRELTAKARAKVMNNSISIENKQQKIDFEKLYVEITVASTFDPSTGELIFKDTDKEMLANKSGKALEKIADTAMKLSGMDEDSLKNAEKN